MRNNHQTVLSSSQCGDYFQVLILFLISAHLRKSAVAPGPPAIDRTA
jgi:hypothetical protein